MSKSKQPNPDEMTFEQAVEELDSIVQRIDKGDDDLEIMMAEHKRGQLLIARCKKLLETAQQQIKTIEAADLQ
tara:strand:+ start:42 stop:260 length:219 start_codon:yes stop_codon:yes gene_type:complete